MRRTGDSAANVALRSELRYRNARIPTPHGERALSTERESREARIVARDTWPSAGAWPDGRASESCSGRVMFSTAVNPERGRVRHVGCLFAIGAGFFPRIALVVLWIATDLVDRAFSTFIVPLLGLIFLPLTTLIYAVAWVPGVHLGNGRWIWVALAFVIELMGYAGTARTNRERMART